MRMKKKREKKTTISNISLKGYLGSFVVLMLVSSLPILLYGEYLHELSSSYLKWYLLLYWLLVSLVFTGVIAYQKYMAFDVPLKRLSEATKQVAKGDFSIYLKPMHSVQKYNELDYVFENFNTMVEELGSTETLKNDFVANVSHEFKAPLAVIKSYASVLQERVYNDSELNDYVETIVAETDKMALLVTNVLKLNKIENQIIQTTMKEYDVSRQLVDMILTFEKVWEDKKVTIDVEVPDNIFVKADPEMMEIVWQNLLSNAFKFTSAGGNVSVKARKNSDGIEVEVIDTGCGMDRETAKRVFDKFYQGDTSHSGKGNGLGLTLVERIVTLMSGTVSLSSKVGEGSNFKIWLPVADSR
ncbi:HAMP domain-containing sensor histidine kinase [Liquorilactobacillus uvarum]|uniref:HAMP domain-containing sensor histidine kinase n=1 Tax=Liquorilactobacillus uvarum TaxID=303240 RepID=UPI0028894114|nr:HAMP domain-containing sensor histidine kinase [Liquorilactobacillus uvarum]